MRGTSPGHRRLSAARAFIAGAAFLAGAASPFPLRAQPDAVSDPAEDVALAIPRVALANEPVALPRPLDASTAALVRRAFREPSAPLDALGDTPFLSTLAGHVLADRLLASPRAAAADLADWLNRYADLPDAPAIHAVLCTRLPRAATPPTAPLLASVARPPPGDDMEPPPRLFLRNAALDRAVHDQARAGHADRALTLVARTHGLSPEYGAQLRAEVARALFGQGRDEDAVAVAEAAHRLAHGRVGLAPWIAGLASWRLGHVDQARAYFEQAWRAPLISTGHRAGAAFWAARTRPAARLTRVLWLQRAAREPRTFYGLLARRALGWPVLPPRPATLLTQADVDAVATTARGQRAFALLQVDQPARAAAELGVLWAETRDRADMGEAVALVAHAAGLDDLAGRIDGALHPATAQLPTTRLRPAGGFRLDPALIYALARLESNFDAAAVSPAGARGLLQLMPGTAAIVAAGGSRALHQPAVNLDLGQRYLTQLAGLDLVGADLIRLLATYNAGPGNFGRWIESMPPETDPLLFIEALPGDETRTYVPRALAYSWLYAARLNLPSPSLDDLAAGLWPRVELRAGWRHAALLVH